MTTPLREAGWIRMDDGGAWRPASFDLSSSELRGTSPSGTTECAIPLAWVSNLDEIDDAPLGQCHLEVRMQTGTVLHISTSATLASNLVDACRKQSSGAASPPIQRRITPVALGRVRSRSALLGLALVISLVLVGLLIGVIATSGEQSVETQLDSAARDAVPTTDDTVTSLPTTSTTAPTTTRPPRLFTNADWNELATSPDTWKGDHADIVGQLLDDPDQLGTDIAFQMYTSPDRTGVTALVRSTVPAFPLTSRSWVRVRGTVLGEMNGENAFGGSVRAVGIQASELAPSSAIDALPPPIRQVMGAGGGTQHGVTVSFDRVDFANDETRVFVTVRNHSNQEFTLLSNSAKAVQGSSQLDQEFSLNDYPSLPTEILPGVTATGVVVFPPADPAAPLKIIMEGLSSDFRTDFLPFEGTTPAR